MKLQGLDDTMTATGVDRLDDTTTALIPLTARWDDVIDRKIDAVSSHARRLEGSADMYHFVGRAGRRGATAGGRCSGARRREQISIGKLWKLTIPRGGDPGLKPKSHQSWVPPNRNCKPSPGTCCGYLLRHICFYWWSQLKLDTRIGGERRVSLHLTCSHLVSPDLSRLCIISFATLDLT